MVTEPTMETLARRLGREPLPPLAIANSGGRSALAADTLRQLGYSNVAHLDGGFPAWKEAGRPVQEVGS